MLSSALELFLGLILCKMLAQVKRCGTLDCCATVAFVVLPYFVKSSSSSLFIRLILDFVLTCFSFLVRLRNLIRLDFASLVGEEFCLILIYLFLVLMLVKVGMGDISCSASFIFGDLITFEKSSNLA